jgi:hypothetical protein
MSDSRYFAHKDDLQDVRDHEGNLKPIQEVALSIPNPIALSLGLPLTDKVVISQLADGEFGDEHAARVLPGTRIVETHDFVVAEALVACGQYDEIDQPTKKLLDDHVKETKAHLAALERRDEQVAKGELEPPDAADHDVNPDNLPAAGQED